MSRRFLAVLATMAITGVAALAASPAAANPVQVVDASEEERCADVTSTPSGGCQFHAEGTLSVLTHTEVNEVTLASCGVAADFYVDADGAGYVHDVDLTGSEPCTSIVQCDDVPWAFATEAVGDGTHDLTVSSCLEHPMMECAGSYDLTLDEDQDELTANEGLVGAGGCEMTTDLTIEDPEAFAVLAAPVISSTGPPNAIVTYDGDLTLTNIGNFTIAGYTCTNVSLVAEIEASPGGTSYVEGFSAGQFAGCGSGSIVLQDLTSAWYGSFKVEGSQRMFFQGVHVRVQYGGLTGNCDYSGVLRGSVLNPGDPTPLTMIVHLSSISNNLSKYAGGFGCPSTINVSGTFQALRTPAAANAWLRPR